MKDIEFNLIDKPWIKVIRDNLSVETLSLKDVLLHAQDYTDLAGETPAQNFAVLRMLLALVYTIFTRVDIDGTPDVLTEIEDADDAYDAALDRWQSLWELKHFPEKPIIDYLNQHHEEFWLFHPTNPFYQISLKQFQLHNGTFDIYSTPKLIGDVLESKNKDKMRPFSLRSGKDKDQIPYDEAARWLINLIAFDDTSAKRKSSFSNITDKGKTTFIEAADSLKKYSVKSNKKSKDKSKIGTGWAGKLGMIYCAWDNLFETLMLNLTFLKDGAEVWSQSPAPSWERTDTNVQVKHYLSCPDDPAALLSLQSRRVFLERKDDMVTGYLILPGDFFDETNAFSEQMTIWTHAAGSSKDNPKWKPKCQTVNRQMWRDFNYYFSSQANVGKETFHVPGIVQWLHVLEENCINPSKKICLRSVAIEYSKQKSSINDLSSDTLFFYIDLLDSSKKGLIKEIETEIKKCDDTAKAVNWLYKDIAIASGSDPDNEKEAQNGKRRFYQAIDQPLRAWLLHFNADVSPENSQMLFEQWEREAYQIAMSIAKQLEVGAGPAAFRGHTIYDKKTEKNYHYSVPKADLKFRRAINKIYPRKDVDHEQTTAG